MANNTSKSPKVDSVGVVSASRAGHTFHERWAARRAMQLVFPRDRLKAIAVEGLSHTETADPGVEAEDVADLVLYYGNGDNFATSEAVQTAQFKYRTTGGIATASYLRKTIEKFADTIVGYEKTITSTEIDNKLTFAFVTNAHFSSDLLEAIGGLKSGTPPPEGEPRNQYDYLKSLCTAKNVDSQRLFSRCEFRASEETLPILNTRLRHTMADWSAGNELRSKSRLFELVEVVREKAGLKNKNNNLIKREDVLVALGCEEDDLFPADTRFIDVGTIIAREQLHDAGTLITSTSRPVFIHAAGGVGKTVFIGCLAAAQSDEYEVVVFDCFGGGAYRSQDQERHLPRVGYVQIANELASRGLCDPLLPGDAESVALIAALRRRLNQTVETLKQQSKKTGVMIIIDAADNAQIEADDRKDDAFPKLLLASLSESSIDGVKLVMTARTHRMPDVVGRAIIVPFPLKPFTQNEAESYLSSRRERFTSSEFATAFSRSSGNARVLAYLVDTWDSNVAGSADKTAITVDQLISEKCNKIFSDLRVAGWQDSDVQEFFSAISLLPPPMPLDELATALEWPISQVVSAASDLAPMLEIVPTHGAIFRDEPTETYVRDTYSHDTASQQAIAQRLQNAQTSSQYAAEALPSFLVAIKDSDRAYALAESSQFPTSIQSDFGRRRLTLARLNAAFRLAVNDGALDRVLGITMRLAQVVAANSRGDDFIRRLPALAATLGDRDAYRRLFSDRSGWRGARDARLTVAHAFSNEMEEAEIHCGRAIDWINWNVRQSNDERELSHEKSGPTPTDYASIVFFNILQKEFQPVDNNLCRWARSSAVPVTRQAIELARQYECTTGLTVLPALAAFAASTKSKSFVLKATLLSSNASFTSKERKSLARSVAKATLKPEQLVSIRDEAGFDFVSAAFAALLHDGPSSARRLLDADTQVRPSAYDYAERYGPSKLWIPVLQACVTAWSRRRPVAVHDLLPQGVPITTEARALKTRDEIRAFLAKLPAAKRKGQRRTRNAAKPTRRFDDRECEQVATGILAVLEIIEPLQTSMRTHGVDNDLTAFIAHWRSHVPTSAPRGFDSPDVMLSRTVGLGFTKLLLQHALTVSDNDASEIIDVISRPRFSLSEKVSVLSLIAGKAHLHSRAGAFARSIADEIRKDDETDQRGNDYALLASALMKMSVGEARVYYRNGLSELDKLGSGDYDLIYAILHYAAIQPGGWIRPELGHRLMNLSQTIVAHDSHKFGWNLFGKACAKSVGTTAATKLMRWNDDEVADYSLGLPQLASYLAAEQHISPSRAAALMSISKDHGWTEWSVADGLASILPHAIDVHEQRAIFEALFSKLTAEHSDGGWPSVWQGVLNLSERLPGIVSAHLVSKAQQLFDEAERKRHEFNSRSSSYTSTPSSITSQEDEGDTNAFVKGLVAKCDPTSATSIDEAIDEIESRESISYHVRHNFFSKLRAACPYSKRLDHLLALAQADNIPFDDTADCILQCASEWSASSANISAEMNSVLSHLFGSKGSELFNVRYGNVNREIKKLAELCGDQLFVLKLVLNTIATERLELNGEQWLQIAMSLSQHVSRIASREALETLLSGPAAGLADQIGEGAYKTEFDISDERELLIAIIWHLLGADDAYVKWRTARALSHFVELGLIDELNSLLTQFDRREVPALKTADYNLSFQNSQQWLLMGLARAALLHGTKLAPLKPNLLRLAARKDIHILSKRHILRCLRNIGSDSTELAALNQEVEVDPRGIVIIDRGWPKHVPAESGFSFDYEFNNTEVPALAYLFHISEGQCVDAIAHEVQRLWPNAVSMDAFPGRDRYRKDRTDRYEYYREHAQKHAMLSAATTLRKLLPVTRRSYDQDLVSPFNQWLDDYDVTFKDGSWLSDHKDQKPEVCVRSLLGPRVKNVESIIPGPAVFESLGFLNIATSAMLPIFGYWKSPDGVHVRIESALGKRRGIVGLCQKFARKPDRDLWLPLFHYDGYDDPHRRASAFEPFVWVLENHSIGVDSLERIATNVVASRSRLGVDLLKAFGLTPDTDFREWRTSQNELALQSQVWGEWMPDPDNHGGSHQNDHGEILWASRDWLDQVLPEIDRQLVFNVTLNKYKNSRFDDGAGAKAVYVGTRPAENDVRFWYAKRSSSTMY
ncbi:ATP-binding protein [Rhodopseudomonas palustris]